MKQPSAVSDQQLVDDEQTLADSGFFWREKDGVRVLVCRALEDAGFANVFSTRGGGVSTFPKNSLNLSGFDDDEAENIYENRRRFLAVFDGEYQLALALQVHGTDIRVVRTAGEIPDSETQADAVVSDLKGVLAGAKTAGAAEIPDLHVVASDPFAARID